MNKMKRIIMLLLAVVFVVSVAACGSDDTPAPTPTPGGDTQTADPDGGGDSEGTAGDGKKVIPPRDVSGMNLIIGDWWTANDAPKRKPTSLREEQLEDLLYMLEQEEGLTVTRWGVSGWGEYLEMFTTSVMAGDPEADIFIMSAGWAYQLMGQGLLYPLNKLESIDLDDEKWNKGIINAYTDDNGDVFAITNEKYVEPRNFMFYNKRIFAEVGIDPEEPYNLQASGDWTWDVLWDYCEKLSRDTDGDGLIDKYAMTGFAMEMIQGFAYSNNAREIAVGPDGKFYNGMLEPNFIEALQFWQRLYDAGHWINDPEDTGEWDWFHRGFYEGHAAICVPIGAYMSETFKEQMDDEWGMVFMPKGPRADDYCSYFGENVYVLPFNTPQEKAEDIMYAFNLYTQRLPFDLENPDYWKDGAFGYQRFVDSRAVDETLAMFYEGRMDLLSRDFVPGGGSANGVDWGPVFDWGFIGNIEQSVIEKIESAAPVVQTAIDYANSGG